MPTLDVWVDAVRTLPADQEEVTLLRDDWELITALAGPAVDRRPGDRARVGPLSTASTVYKLHSAPSRYRAQPRGGRRPPAHPAANRANRQPPRRNPAGSRPPNPLLPGSSRHTPRGRTRPAAHVTSPRRRPDAPSTGAHGSVRPRATSRPRDTPRAATQAVVRTKLVRTAEETKAEQAAAEAARGDAGPSSLVIGTTAGRSKNDRPGPAVLLHPPKGCSSEPGSGADREPHAEELVVQPVGDSARQRAPGSAWASPCERETARRRDHRLASQRDRVHPACTSSHHTVDRRRQRGDACSPIGPSVGTAPGDPATTVEERRQGCGRAPAHRRWSAARGPGGQPAARRASLSVRSSAGP